jgi:NACalpha-BTF3-like transcription factor
MLREMIAHQDVKQAKVDAVKMIIEKLLEEETFISSAQVLLNEVKEHAEFDISIPFAAEQLRANGLKF